MTARTLRTTASLVTCGSLVALANGAGTARSGPAPVALRIESLSQQSLRVQISSTPPGLWPDSAPSIGAQPRLVVWTPSVVMIADSVRTVGVAVLGPGAVRLHLERGGGASPQKEPRVIWGRDITLRRGVDGEFRPVAQVLPLHP